MGTYFYVQIMAQLKERQVEEMEGLLERLNQQLSAGTMGGFSIDQQGMLQELLMSVLHQLFGLFVVLAVIALLVSLFLPNISKLRE